MDFIWKNKGALAVSSVLGAFLLDPLAFMQGLKILIVEPVLSSLNWNLITLVLMGLLFWKGRRFFKRS